MIGGVRNRTRSREVELPFVEAASELFDKCRNLRFVCCFIYFQLCREDEIRKDRKHEVGGRKDSPQIVEKS